MMTEQADTGSEFMNTKEAAFFLRIAVNTLHKWTSRGTLPHFKPNGRVILFRKKDLEAWVNEGRVMTAQELAEAARSIKGGRK